MNEPAAKYALRGCLVLKNQTFIPIEEVLKLCRKFHSSSGSTLALALTKMQRNIDNTQNIEVLILDKRKGLGRLLSKFIRGLYD